jgi:HD superfamily phosphodiesterase
MELTDLLRDDRRLRILFDEIRAIYSSADPLKQPNLYEHGLTHIGRVIRNSFLISDEENVDQDTRTLILAAALCHDLGYFSQAEDHVLDSVIKAPPLLQRASFYPTDVELINSIILAHSSKGKPPVTLPEKILHVADKCDLLGYDGIVRQILHQSREFRERDELCLSLQAESDVLYHKLLKIGAGARFLQTRWEEAKSFLAQVVARRLELDPNIKN